MSGHLLLRHVIRNFAPRSSRGDFCILLALLAFVAPLSVCAHDGVLYTGTCRNVTHSMDGNLKLFLTEADGAIKGYMSISGWLVGSGEVTGTRKGNALALKTYDPITETRITWQGTLRDSKLGGEYFVPPNARLEMDKQVGEWEVQVSGLEGKQSDEDVKALFLMACEMDLNAPRQLPGGDLVTGAQAIFDSIHPAGTGVSVCVTDAVIQWKDGAAESSYADVHKYSLEYVLYWHGVLTPTGWTRLRLSYNTELQAVTSHEVVQTTGTTRGEVEEIAYGIGFFLGRAAMESMLNGK